MRIPWGRRGALLAACAFFVLGLAPGVSAQPEISAEFGFDHQLVRYRFAPIQVTLSGLEDPIAGHLIVQQFVGSDPSTPVSVEQEIVSGRIQNGVYRGTLPAYDPILPIIVQLIDEQGNVIASVSESVRQSARGLPFAVVAGAPYHVDDTEAIVDPSELPADWWAYDPVSALWLTSPLLTRAVWVGLGAWVSAGGSLVLFSGSDFYQWDNPLARELLPFSEPSLRDGVGSAPLLVGRPRAGAQVLLTKQDLPLLVRIPYGAGYVSLVTERFRDLDEMDLRRIEPRIPTSRRLLSADALSKDLLNETPVLRPMYAFAPLVVVAVLVALLAMRRRSVRHARSAAVLFLASIAVIAVASGLYLNRLGRMVYHYSISTTLHISTGFGCSTVSYAFFSLEPTQITIPQEKGAFPAQVQEVPSAKSVYAMRSEPGSTAFDLPARARRFVRGCTTQGAGFRLAVDDTVRSIRVEPLEERQLVAAMIFADGYFHRLPLDSVGVNLRLDDLRRLGTSAMTSMETAIYSSVDRWMPSLTGTWLLTLSETGDLTRTVESPGKVRVMDVDIVEGVAE
jgi:hypothetical protein